MRRDVGSLTSSLEELIGAKYKASTIEQRKLEHSLATIANRYLDANPSAFNGKCKLCRPTGELSLLILTRTSANSDL